MTTRIELPSGKWVDVKDPDELTRSAQKRLAKIAADTPNMTLAGLAGIDETWRLIVVAWSYDCPLPKDDMDAVDETVSAADAIEIDRYAEKTFLSLFPDYTPSKAALGDPDSPT